MISHMSYNIMIYMDFMKKFGEPEMAPQKTCHGKLF